MKKSTELHSPCCGCHRPCNYTQCNPYRLWLNRCWNQYRRWPQQQPKPREKKENAWRYMSLTLVEDFLRDGPCGGCPFQAHCRDTQSCPAYDTWVELRWARLRKQLGYSEIALEAAAKLQKQPE